MTQDALIRDLDSLIKRANEVGAELQKTAAPGDPLNEDNGTSAPETGAQMASNNEEAGKHTAAKVDGDAETNPAGASVEMSTEGATAVSTDGQTGTQGADLEKRHQAANGDEGGFEGEPSDWDKKKTACEALITEARTIAGELKIAAEKMPVDEKAEKAMTKLAGLLGKSAGRSETAAPLTQFDRFLAKRAMEAGGLPPEAMADDVGAAAGGAEDIIAGLQSGAIGEEEAAAILQEAVAAGALTEEDIAELGAMLDAGAAPEGAPLDDPMAGDPMAGDPMAGDPMAGDPMAGDPMAGDPMMGGDPMAMKVAMLEVGPDHPDYIKKLDALHKEAQEFGYRLAVKTAQEIRDEGDTDVGILDEAFIGDGGGGEPPVDEVVEGMVAEPTDIAPQSPEEEAALAEVLGELGLDSQGADELMTAEIPELDKVASYKSRVRGALLAKAAALRTAKQAQPQNKD